MSNNKRSSYSCYILDDDLHSVEAISEYVIRLPDLCLIGSSTDPTQAIKEIGTIAIPDIIFLDVEMPQVSGLDLIDSFPKGSAIILITGHLKYALDGYDKDVVDFLLKPIIFDRFAKAVEKAKKNICMGISWTKERKAQYVFVRPLEKTGTLRIMVEDIVYVEVQDHTLYIITSEGEHTINSSIKNFQSKLPEDFLFRVHRSFLVNIEAVKYFRDNQINMTGGKKIPLGITFRKDFLKKWNSVGN